MRCTICEIRQVANPNILENGKYCVNRFTPPSQTHHVIDFHLFADPLKQPTVCHLNFHWRVEAHFDQPFVQVAGAILLLLLCCL